MYSYLKIKCLFFFKGVTIHIWNLKGSLDLNCFLSEKWAKKAGPRPICTLTSASNVAKENKEKGKKSQGWSPKPWKRGETWGATSGPIEDVLPSGFHCVLSLHPSVFPGRRFIMVIILLSFYHMVTACQWRRAVSLVHIWLKSSHISCHGTTTCHPPHTRTNEEMIVSHGEIPNRSIRTLGCFCWRQRKLTTYRDS